MIKKVCFDSFYSKNVFSFGIYSFGLLFYLPCSVSSGCDPHHSFCFLFMVDKVVGTFHNLPLFNYLFIVDVRMTL
jgi:hypothetical protein